MRDLKSMDLEEMISFLKELGEPAFRGKQVFQWLHRGVTSFEEMTNLSKPLREKLTRLPSDKKRIAYLAEATADITDLELFPQYLTLLFEIDALFCNDDRHLNNIAVLERDGKYDYCPIFDNGAGLLSNTQLSPMDIALSVLISALRARPFNTAFTRQMNTARSLYGTQLVMPKLTTSDIREILEPVLNYYPQRDRGIMADRVKTCILIRQRKLQGKT